jgi:hypothetical protein
LQVGKLQVGKLQVGKLQVGKLQVGKLQVGKLQVGKLKLRETFVVGEKMQLQEACPFSTHRLLPEIFLLV